MGNTTAEKTIKQLKVYLGLEEAEHNSLELNEQTVFATKFSEGEAVYFKKDEDQVPLPKGVYTTKDGKQLLSVDENGAFVSLEEVPEEEAPEEEAPEAKEEGEKEYLTKEDAAEQFVSKEDFLSLLKVVEELHNGATGMASENKILKEDLSKVEGELTTTKQLLSKVESPKVVHNPEPKQKKREGFSSMAMPLSNTQRNIFKLINSK